MTPQILNRPALVLNRNWQPVHVVRVSRAIVLVFKEIACLVDRDYQMYTWQQWAELPVAPGEPFIRTTVGHVRVPEVVSLATYDRLPRRTVPFSRRNLLRRDRFTCQYCSSQPSNDRLTIDHILPRSRGGESDWTNCVLACEPCNHRKADRTPEEAGMKLLTQPRQPSWQPLVTLREDMVESWAHFMPKTEGMQAAG